MDEGSVHTVFFKEISLEVCFALSQSKMMACISPLGRFQSDRVVICFTQTGISSVLPLKYNRTNGGHCYSFPARQRAITIHKENRRSLSLRRGSKREHVAVNLCGGTGISALAADHASATGHSLNRRETATKTERKRKKASPV